MRFAGVRVKRYVNLIDDQQRKALHPVELCVEAALAVGVGEQGDPLGRGSMELRSVRPRLTDEVKLVAHRPPRCEPVGWVRVTGVAKSRRQELVACARPCPPRAFEMRAPVSRPHPRSARSFASQRRRVGRPSRPARRRGVLQPRWCCSRRGRVGAWLGAWCARPHARARAACGARGLGARMRSPRRA